MLTLLKDRTYNALRSKLTIVYILNGLDIVFTYLLLKTGLFYEANILMQKVVQSSWLSIGVKLILPGILIIYVLRRIEDLPEENLRVCNWFMNTVLLLYTAINLSHLFYTFYYLFA